LFILLHILVAVMAYVIGGVNGAIITSKYFYRKDIRKYGSGNPGLTNFYRVFGKRAVTGVIIIDMLKTVVPVVIGRVLFRNYYDMEIYGSIFAGLFVMLGHSYPIFYGFNGGKTVMAIGTFVFFVDWRLALIAWAVFIIVLAATRYVSLGSIIAALTYPILVYALGIGGTREIIVSVLSVLLLVFRHRENIRRLIRGTESRFKIKKSDKP
jgi:glycerol-3-phosphate acyltransferase PlsY